MDRRNPPATASVLLRKGELRLAACGIESARLDCELLLAHVLGVDRGAMIHGALRGGDLPAEAAARYRALVARRARREPLAYLVGRREFWSLDLEVTPAVLIPRPETETLVSEALARLPASAGRDGPIRVWDVGTGSGAVALALAAERPDVRITASDLSAPALAVAARNLARHDPRRQISLVQGDLLTAAAPARPGGPRLAMVVANPPYVGTEERGGLMPEVRDHEPAEALFAGPGGLDAIRRLVPQAGDALAGSGWLLMEMSTLHAGAVEALLREAGIWQDVGVARDTAGRPRVAIARREERRP